MDTSANTYVLFLDMQEVEDLVLCKQVVNQARKHSHNPVLGPGDVHDWDGVVWHKPMLGLYEFNGRKDNSICFRAPDSQANHFSVVKDLREKNPQRRYQTLAKMNVIPGDAATTRHVIDTFLATF